MNNTVNMFEILIHTAKIKNIDHFFPTSIFDGCNKVVELSNIYLNISFITSFFLFYFNLFNSVFLR